MPRLLFYIVLGTLVFFWARRFLRLRPGGPRGAQSGGMPKTLVCGGCGTAYDPHASGWICPKCGR